MFYYENSAHPKLTHPKGRHDDLLWALCLALYGIKMNPPGISLCSSFSYSEINDVQTQDNRTVENLVSRLQNSGLSITNVKITNPGERSAL